MNINLESRDLRPLHRAVVQATVDLVQTVTPDDLGLPTPCAGWGLAELLAHMTVQHHGFAAAARGHGADLAVWDTATVAAAVADGAVGAYTAAVADVLDAFAAEGALEAPFALPELGGAAAGPRHPRWRLPRHGERTVRPGPTGYRCGR